MSAQIFPHLGKKFLDWSTNAGVYVPRLDKITSRNHFSG